ncbi:MAG: type II secretion system F family protein [Vulcanimicrobiota bacterium]
MSQASLSQQIRRLAALAQSGQSWDESVPSELSGQYRAWLEAAQGSSQPHLLLYRLAAYCDEMQRLRTEAGRLLSYPRLVLLYLGLLLVGLLVTVWMLGSAWTTSLALAGVLALSLLAYYSTRNQELAWSWLGQRGRGRFEQLLWCSHLAQMLEIDMDLPQACHWAARAVLEPEVRRQAESLEQRVLSGDSLAQALQGCDWDPLIAWAADAASDHQALAGALGQASATLEENLKEDIARTLAWLQPAALAMVGALILVTMVIFWLNYQSLCLEAAA